MASGANQQRLVIRDDDAHLVEQKQSQLRNFLKIINTYSGDDPLQPWLRCLKWAKTSLPAGCFPSVYCNLLDLCAHTFSKEARYLSDTRYLQVWIQLADCCHADAEFVFKRMEALHIGQSSTLFYIAYAIFHEAQGSILKAHKMYQLGFSRQAKPVRLLEDSYKEFVTRVANQLCSSSLRDVFLLQKSNMLPLAVQNDNSITHGIVESTQMASSFPLQNLTNIPMAVMSKSAPVGCKDSAEVLSPTKDHKQMTGTSDHTCQGLTVNPWENETIDRLLNGLKPPLVQYQGLRYYNQKHKGASLTSLKCAPHNKVLELGTKRYHLKGCTGRGAFAQVFKACDEQDKENVVVLKIQKPPCPWEYYIYSHLNKRIPPEERSSFGRAWKMHVYDDCSIMVCAYGERGTLQDVVNSYIATGQKMDEILCMYYTVEMLRMLEVLHSTGIIHGDFKPDNLLIRNTGKITDEWAPDRPGCWIHQGLCLIDWGRSIDLNLFPPGTMLEGDCHTSGFQCVEMQQQKPWTFQVDTYGLCCIVHVMLHCSYMEIEALAHSDMTQTFRPKIPFKRYHKSDLWGELFSRLLNVKSCRENPSLTVLRKSFERFLTSDAQYPKKLKELMVRQSKIMCSQR